MPVLSIRIVSGQFLSAYFLFWEILNLNLLFAVNVTVNLSNMEKERKTFFCSHSLPHPPHCFFFSHLIDLSPQSECLEQDTIRLVSVRWVLQRSSCSCSLQRVPVTSSYNEYRKSSTKPPLSNEPSSLISPPPPPLPLLFFTNKWRLYLSMATVKLGVDWSGMVYSPTGSFGCTTSNFLYLSFSTLCSSYLWRTDTIVFAKLSKSPPLK